jgi:hypothetical protein
MLETGPYTKHPYMAAGPKGTRNIFVRTEPL